MWRWHVCPKRDDENKHKSFDSCHGHYCALKQNVIVRLCVCLCVCVDSVDMNELDEDSYTAENNSEIFL